MEKESTSYQGVMTEDEGLDKEWLSLPEGEKEAYQTKAAAYLAEAIRSADPDSGYDEAMKRWNRLAFKGDLGTEVELTKEDYDAAAGAIEDLEKPKDFMDRIGTFLAKMQLDVMAKRMMWHDQKKVSS